MVDLDDTLTDLATFELEVWEDVARMLAARVPQSDPDELRRRYEDAMEPHYQRVLSGELNMLGYRRARLEDALAPWAEVDDELFESYWRVKQRIVDEVPPKAGAHDALRELRAAGLRIGVLTNGPSDMQRDKLDRLGFMPLVDEVAISEEIGAAKPSGAAFAAVVRMLGLAPAELAMVGDNWGYDVAGALDAGFAAAYYVGPARSGERRECAFVLGSVAELPGALGL